MNGTLRASCVLAVTGFTLVAVWLTGARTSSRERAVVYIDEADLASLREAYLTDGRAEVHSGHRQDLSSWWRGTGESGLILFGYVLRDRSVEEFAGLLAAAEEALTTAPR